MPFSLAKRFPYNARKRLILAVLDSAWPGGFRADTIAWKTGIRDRRHIYWRLNRLARWGLIQRRRGADGLWIYRITERGRKRLAWLQRQLA